MSDSPFDHFSHQSLPVVFFFLLFFRGEDKDSQKVEFIAPTGAVAIPDLSEVNFRLERCHFSPCLLTRVGNMAFQSKQPAHLKMFSVSVVFLRKGVEY